MRGECSPVFAARKQPTLVDYPGYMAGIFFVAGCNFQCGFCHNAELARPRPGLPWTRLDTVCRRFREHWADAAVITGGEPTLHDGLPELVSFFKNYGWKVKLDTNGSRPELLASLLKDLDAVAMDLKCALRRYPEIAGFNDVAALERSVALLKDWPGEVTFRTTIIEVLHDERDMKELGALVQGARRMVLQPFIPRATLPDERLRREPRTSPETLRRLGAVLARYVPEVLTSEGERLVAGDRDRETG